MTARDLTRFANRKTAFVGGMGLVGAAIGNHSHTAMMNDPLMQRQHREWGTTPAQFRNGRRNTIFAGAAAGVGGGLFLASKMFR